MKCLEFHFNSSALVVYSLNGSILGVHAHTVSDLTSVISTIINSDRASKLTALQLQFPFWAVLVWLCTLCERWINDASSRCSIWLASCLSRCKANQSVPLNFHRSFISAWVVLLKWNSLCCLHRSCLDPNRQLLNHESDKFVWHRHYCMT